MLKIHEDALQKLKALPASLQGKMVRQINKLSEFSTLLREPDTKAITNGFLNLEQKQAISVGGFTFTATEKNLHFKDFC